ncbi:MAG TPA: recombinase family protein [Mycobacteriales bacterium]
MVQAAAIYARISQDRGGDGLGVQRQLEDCRHEADRHDWPVAEEYVDDDVSAYQAKPRPAYRRMLRDLRDQRRDAVIVWHLDRLHRRPIELEEFVQTCTVAGVTRVVTLHGDFNLGSGDGLLVARLLSAVAANESDSKRRRGQRKSLEIAQAGKPHGGGNRPFAFAADQVTIDPHEAAIYRQLVDRALAGETLTSLCRWLVDNDVRTVTGKPWRTPTLRQILINPRYWGQRVHRGEVIGPSVWEPIVDPDRGEALRAILTNPGRANNRGARSYLLSGLCRCGLCGTKMASGSREGRRRYLCRSGHDFGGCGRTAISAEPVDRLIAEATLYRLDTPELAAALANAGQDIPSDGSLQAAIDADIAQLDELAGLYSERGITAAEWLRARSGIELRLTEARRRLSTAQGLSAVEGFVGNGDALRREWASLNLGRQRAIVTTTLSHVVVGPATRRGGTSIDPNRVKPIWRL